MRTLTIKNIPDDLYDLLKRQAGLNRRSLNSEVIMLIEQAVGSPRYSVEAALQRARKLRERAEEYRFSDEEIEEAIEAGRQIVTIAIDEQVYEGLYSVIGSRQISRFIEDLVRPHVLFPDLEEAYRLMAEDEEREAEALEWAEVTVGDVSDEAR